VQWDCFIFIFGDFKFCIMSVYILYKVVKFHFTLICWRNYAT
jgi:hypothetical protein